MVQRIGRPARGDRPGTIHICISQENLGRQEWLRQWYRWINDHNGEKVTINQFTNTLTSGLQQRFRGKKSELGQQTNTQQYYGSMPASAATIAGLAWVMMTRHSGLQHARKPIIAGATPPIAKEMLAILQPVRQLQSDPIYADGVNLWINQFEAEIQQLRSFDTTITVFNKCGTSWVMPWLRIAKNTDLFERYEPEMTANGGWRMLIDEPHWRDAQLDQAVALQPANYLILPHDSRLVPVNGDKLQNALLKKLDADINSQLLPLHVVKALEAVKHLTQATGIVCVHKEQQDIAPD